MCKACTNAYNKRYYEENREKLQNKIMVYRNIHRGKILSADAKQRAKRKGMPFTLTEADIERIDKTATDGVCEMTGLPFDLTGGRTWNSPSLDRIDPQRGYEPGNVRVVLLGLNQAMGDWGIDIASKFVNAFFEHQRKKS